jgi:hypothetical protein
MHKVSLSGMGFANVDADQSEMMGSLLVGSSLLFLCQCLTLLIITFYDHNYSSQKCHDRLWQMSDSYGNISQ